MTVEIITPEARLFHGEAKAIQLPGKDGLFQILDKHAPIIAALGKGTLKIDLPEGFQRSETLSKRIELQGNTMRIDIQGGVVEVSENKAIVLVN